jgi:hypothetical protein
MTQKNFQVLGVAPATADHGVMGYFEKPSGGIVFNAGTTDWAHGLADDERDQRITSNIVNALCDTMPGLRAAITRKGHHTISATIFGSDRLDVQDVDRRNLELFSPGFDSNAKSRRSRRFVYEDVDGDGLLDATSHFHLRRRARRNVDEVLCIAGTIKGRAFRVCDEPILSARIPRSEERPIHIRPGSTDGGRRSPARGHRRRPTRPH